jgi:hypothetical protein
MVSRPEEAVSARVRWAMEHLLLLVEADSTTARVGEVSLVEVGHLWAATAQWAEAWEDQAG